MRTFRQLCKPCDLREVCTPLGKDESDMNLVRRQPYTDLHHACQDKILHKTNVAYTVNWSTQKYVGCVWRYTVHPAAMRLPIVHPIDLHETLTPRIKADAILVVADSQIDDPITIHQNILQVHWATHHIVASPPGTHSFQCHHLYEKPGHDTSALGRQVKEKIVHIQFSDSSHVIEYSVQCCTVNQDVRG